MIPTAHKDKISSNLTFPLNAKLLSESLAGVHSFADLSLRFQTHWDESNQDVERKAAAGESLEFLRALYTNMTPDSYNSHNIGTHGPDWSLAVFAVPREFGNLARDLFLAEGVEPLRKWLDDPRDEILKPGQGRISIQLSPLESRLLIR